MSVYGIKSPTPSQKSPGSITGERGLTQPDIFSGLGEMGSNKLWVVAAEEENPRALWHKLDECVDGRYLFTIPSHVSAFWTASVWTGQHNTHIQSVL